MGPGNETIRMILPIRAGFTKFCPIPPKNCFTTTIATNAPMGIIQKGIVEGKLNASNSPVTTALKSFNVLLRFSIFLVMYSNRTQETTLMTVTAKARGPKSQTDAAKAGTRAIITSLIIDCEVSPDLIWGDAATVGFTFCIRAFSLIF